MSVPRRARSNKVPRAKIAAARRVGSLDDARRPPRPAEAVEELAALVRDVGGDDLADRLEQALDDEVKLLALSLDERALMLSALEDPPQQLAELRTVLLPDHQWPRREGLE